MGIVEPDAAFLVARKKDKIGEALTNSALLENYREKSADLLKEMEFIRFGLIPVGGLFNPTERCNLNCSYCYIPEEMRQSGVQMSSDELAKALAILKDYFGKTLPTGRLPQIVFHGSEPMLAREAVFAGNEQYAGDFSFGVQTNGTLLDDAAIEFLTSRGIGIGLSLDGHEAGIADLTRKNWAEQGYFDKIVSVLEKLKGYPNYNVICTVTTQNMKFLSEIVDFMHDMEVPIGMLNPVRCTRSATGRSNPRTKSFHSTI